MHESHAVGHTPGNFLRALAETSALSPWLAPMEKALFVPAGLSKFHGNNSVFEHTCEVMNAVAAMSLRAAMPEKERSLAVWIALCHDLGKLETDASLLPRHIGHESRGLHTAENLVASLRLARALGQSRPYSP
jgi:tRNA nucleotidyltransferase (CCA-adding enzyme)